jgi:hypothetical protein
MLRARVVEITAPSSLAIIADNLAIRLRSQASHATRLGLMLWSRHGAELWYIPHRLWEPGMAHKVPSRPAHM